MNSSDIDKVNVFISYSHKDEDLLEQLMTHLASLKRQDYIQTWYDRDISGGREWAKEIEANLAAADVILLLISADFIASDYCWRVELEQAIKRHDTGTARVIPIILKPCDWTDAPFGKLEAFPKNAKPVVSYTQPDEAFLEIVKGVGKAVKEVIAQKQISVESTQRVSLPSTQTTESTEPPVGLWVHGWEYQRFEHPFEQTVIEIPWQKYFDRETRHVPAVSTWLNTLQPELKQVKADLIAEYGAKYLDIRGQLPLSYSLAIGATFPRVGRFKLRVQQDFPDGPSQLWHSQADASSLKFKTVAEDGVKGDDLLVAFGISGGLESAVKNWQLDNSVPLTAEVYLEPETGANRSSLKSESDAVALAMQAGEAIFDLQEKYGAKRTHIILRAPAGFALFLGQQLNAVGIVIAYEWTQNRGYHAAVQLQS